MKRIGCMCVALSALFVLDSHGAGIADWSDSARECLENYVKAGVAASDKDVKDTQDRWNRHLQSRNYQESPKIVSLNGNGASCRLCIDGFGVDVPLSEPIDFLSRVDHDQTLSDRTHGHWNVTESNGWRHLTLELSNTNGMIVGKLAVDLYGNYSSVDGKFIDSNVIVLNEVSLPGYSFECKGNNVNLLDNNINCKELTIAALNSAVCVSNNIGKIGHFQLFTHNGVVDSRDCSDGMFFAKCSDWLNILANHNKDNILIFGMNADKCNAEGVNVQFAGNANIGNFHIDDESKLHFGFDNIKDKKLALQLAMWRSYFNPAEHYNVNLCSFNEGNGHFESFNGTDSAEVIALNKTSPDAYFDLKNQEYGFFSNASKSALKSVTGIKSELSKKGVLAKLNYQQPVNSVDLNKTQILIKQIALSSWKSKYFFFYFDNGVEVPLTSATDDCFENKFVEFLSDDNNLTEVEKKAKQADKGSNLGSPTDKAPGNEEKDERNRPDIPAGRI